MAIKVEDYIVSSGARHYTFRIKLDKLNGLFEVKSVQETDFGTVEVSFDAPTLEAMRSKLQAWAQNEDKVVWRPLVVFCVYGTDSKWSSRPAEMTKSTFEVNAERTMMKDGRGHVVPFRRDLNNCYAFWAEETEKIDLFEKLTEQFKAAEEMRARIYSQMRELTIELAKVPQSARNELTAEEIVAKLNKFDGFRRLGDFSTDNDGLLLEG